jgi:glucose-6-phosphate dehydrogenase assembly protein OpcA
MSNAVLTPPPAFDLLGEEVALPRIEKGLRGLFEGADEEGGIARASLMNLALYNENPDELGSDAAALAELTSETACRTLLIHADPRAVAKGARARIQAHCQIDRQGRKTVCTEQISFFLGGVAPGLLRNVVLANLDSDLPLAFWWRGELSESFEERLYSRIDRFLFDGEAWQSPRDPLLRLLEAQRTAPFVMHDLAFTRLNSIRQAVAKAFERPALARGLVSLSEVSIRHAKGRRLSGLYLAAWLAARLGVEFDAVGSSAGEVRCRPGRSGAREGLRIRLGELAPGRPGCVEVDFALGPVRVEIARCETRDFLRTLTRHEDGSADEDWLPARRLNDASLVADILNRAGRNRAHAQTLPGLLRLLAL